MKTNGLVWTAPTNWEGHILFRSTSFVKAKPILKVTILKPVIIVTEKEEQIILQRMQSQIILKSIT